MATQTEAFISLETGNVAKVNNSLLTDSVSSGGLELQQQIRRIVMTLIILSSVYVRPRGTDSELFQRPPQYFACLVWAAGHAVQALDCDLVSSVDSCTTTILTTMQSH